MGVVKKVSDMFSITTWVGKLGISSLSLFSEWVPFDQPDHSRSIATIYPTLDGTICQARYLDSSGSMVGMVMIRKRRRLVQILPREELTYIWNIRVCWGCWASTQYIRKAHRVMPISWETGPIMKCHENRNSWSFISTEMILLSSIAWVVVGVPARTPPAGYSAEPPPHYIWREIFSWSPP